MLLSECFIKTIHSLLLEETLIGLLPLLLVRFYIIVASQAEFLSWAKMTVLTDPVASATLSALRWEFMAVLLPDVNVVPKESFVCLYATIMILFNVIYSINLHMSAVTARCGKVVKKIKLIRIIKQMMNL